MTVKIDIKGPIVSNDDAWIYEWFEMDATWPRKIIEALDNANGEDVIVSINSPGGYVWDGSEIYTALKNYPGYTESQIVGLAASAASFIATGTKKVRIAPTGQMMVHNASTIGFGDHRDMTKTAERLRVTDKTIVNAYMIKTGKTEEELLNMMAEETWMGPQQALENGFVDEIMFMDTSVKLAASASVNGSGLIPQKVIDGLRNKVMNEKKSEPVPSNFVTEETLRQMFAEFKNELKNEVAPQEPKEPEQAPAAKRNLSRLFLNL
ncbi:peptidase [Bacillus sp. FJAT-27225]|uniref:head maturation protease, ClpP-related n=1 Tax=Bacillus sp. FJAT-27225 TaxID=1743144 RepID=UPI00080C2541|nr:head maturation protease, ClpP-related [Bacillus sp. FJAT-27225]OCA84491.1 peptidase [Bacillus sp. FJAT-27225]